MKPSERIKEMQVRQAHNPVHAVSLRLESVVRYLDEQYERERKEDRDKETQSRFLQANMNEMYGSMGRERESKIRELDRQLRVANKKLSKVQKAIDAKGGLHMVHVDILSECLSDTEPCGTYGCMNPRPIENIMCNSCYAEQKEDPDAFK